MKNIKTLIKNNILFIIVEFNLLLSVIGIFTAMAAAKNERYDNPFLFSLPLSVVLWFLFAFVPRSQEKVKTEKEIESSRIFYGLPPRIKISRLQEIIIRSVKEIILAVHILVFLFDITMMLFMSLKTAVIPAFFSP